MDNSFNPFGDRGFHDFQAYRPDGHNSNHLNVFSQRPQQQRNEQQQALSPGQPRSRGSSFAGSPASLSSAHRPPVSQPPANRLQHGYFPIGATVPPRSTTSPVSPGYQHSISDSMNSEFNSYGYEGNFGGMSMPGDSGIVRSRNNSE